MSGRPTALVFVLLLAQGSGCAGPEPAGALPEVAAARASPEPALPAPRADELTVHAVAGYEVVAV